VKLINLGDLCVESGKVVQMKKVYFILLLFFATIAVSQKILDLTYYSVFGKEKNFQFFVNNEFSYRLKGKLFYHTHILTNMQDSFLVFDNDHIVKLDQIRSVRVRGANISGWIYKAGIGFLALDVAGNLIQCKTPIVNERACIVTAWFIAAGAVISYFQDKHIRVTKNCIFRIINIDTQSLNASK
jgi:hypothetical protein